MKEGDIFDGNGYTITVDHPAGYNSTTGKYDHYLYNTGQTYDILGTDYASGNHPGALQHTEFLEFQNILVIQLIQQNQL